MDIVYGPVQSLRYGNSLGINLLGSEKVCSYNCVYCHLGPSQLTMNKIRKDYVFPNVEQISLAFKEYIKKSVPTDAIVVSGNGEPTLHPDFEEMMKTLVGLREAHLPGVKIVVLTNGAHLDSKKVIAGLNLVDERVIKVDAGNDLIFQKVNAPLIRMNMAKFLSGFRKLEDCTVQALFFNGEVDNTANDLVDEWIEVIGMIKPKAVQICTLSRPSRVLPTLHPAVEDVLYGIAFKLKKRTTLEASVFSV